MKRGRKSNHHYGQLLGNREIEVLDQIYSKGKSYNEATQALFISPHTLKTHAHKIYKKLGVKNRFHAGLNISVMGSMVQLHKAILQS